MVMADDPAGVIAINVTGSMNLLNEAMAGGVDDVRLLLVGRGDRKFLREGADRRGLSDAAGLDLWLLQGRDGLSCCAACGSKVPLDICSLRLTAVYGPGRQTEFNVDTIVRAALAGKPARLDPLTDWPYVYVDDAADAAIAACFSERASSSPISSRIPSG